MAQSLIEGERDETENDQISFGVSTVVYSQARMCGSWAGRWSLD